MNPVNFLNPILCRVLQSNTNLARQMPKFLLQHTKPKADFLVKVSYKSFRQLQEQMEKYKEHQQETTFSNCA